MTLTFLHTAEVHRATFAALCARLAPHLPSLRTDQIVQIVREDWLARAQSGGIDAALTAEITATIGAAQGMVICTCTTLGPVAEAAGAIRIDRPMMAEAAATGGPVLMLYCLRSTAAPSAALLQAEMARAGNGAQIHSHFIEGAWPHFEAGDTARFAAAIAAAGAAETARLTALGTPPAAVVLAQASMACAAQGLDGALRGALPVLTSPERAVRYGARLAAPS